MRRRRGEQDREFGARHPRDQLPAAVGVGMALDPPRRRLQHGVAGRAAEGGVDRVVAADRDQQDDRRLPPLRSCSCEPGRAARPSRTPVSGSRPAGGRSGPAIVSDRPTISPSPRTCIWWAIRPPPASPRWAKAVASPVASSRSIALAGGPAAVGVELAEQFHQADPPPVILAEAGLAGQRRRQLDAARAGLPAPGSGVALLVGAAPGAAARPLGMAAGEQQGVQQLRLGERAHQEVGGAILVEGVERGGVGARQQDQQGRRIGLDRVGDRAHRLAPLGERAARVDHRDRRARGDEPRLGIVRRAAPRSAASPRPRQAGSARRGGGRKG